MENLGVGYKVYFRKYIHVPEINLQVFFHNVEVRNCAKLWKKKKKICDTDENPVKYLR